MTKVEELRARLMNSIGLYGVESDKAMPTEMALALDSLIAAATEEGCDEGWAASKMLWTRMQQWNDEWREENPKERSLTLLDAIDLIEWKIAKARAEGAEAEREKIRSKSDFCSANTSASFFENVYLVPASLLATATKEADHGKS